MRITSADAQAYRYQLLRTAQGILAVKGKGWKEQHRTCWCSRSLRRGDFGEEGGGFIDVYRNEARTGASLTGLNRCGNLHTCPVCSAKVGELRRKQLSAAQVANIKAGRFAYLLTFTFPHDNSDNLDDLQPKFDKSRNRFLNSRLWKGLKLNAHAIGSVISLEFTISQENGWHPHIHLLLFCDRQAFGEGAPVNDAGDLESVTIAQMKREWCNKLLKVGLGDNAKMNDMLLHGLNVRGGEKAAEYIAKFGRDSKWGASSELARSHAKIGTAGERWGNLHFTPFQLLVWAADRDGWAVARFREYAQVTEGKRALVWSPGLKKALGVEDIDEEIWAATDDTKLPDQILIGTLTAEQFSIIMSRRLLPQFMLYVATCCDTQEHLTEYIDILREAEKVCSGALLVKSKSGRHVAYP